MADQHLTYIDGAIDFSGGVDSLKVTTIQSSENPNGLARNQVAWLNNGTVRGGGVMARTGWVRRGKIGDGTTLYQGGILYSPDFADPYLILMIGGNVVKVDPDFAANPANLSTSAALQMPDTAPYGYMCQAEKFLIIQAGDNTTLPLFWDGATLRRSKGITNTSVLAGTPGVNEIPAATAMDYYQGRLWYAQGRNYSAGDIVGGGAGTVGNDFRDAVLNVTENPLVLGGDGFSVPTNSGNIRAIFHNATLNSNLGQGQLLIGTRKAIYAQDVPISRSEWIATDNSAQPKQTVVQLVNGPVNDRCVVPANGDVFYQAIDPSIRSLQASIRNFGDWGNVPISANENRILSFNDRALMRFASGALFDNRMLQTALPRAVPQGVVHDALIPMDFVPIQSYGTTLVPVWEGMYEGLPIFQLFNGDFGGRERCFAVVLSKDNTLELWELTDDERTDINAAGEARVNWIVEFPAFTWGKNWDLKKLVGGEIWLDKVFGEVILTLQYRTDQDPCWQDWHTWKICNSRSSVEDVNNPVAYPLTPYREGYRATETLPMPQGVCTSAGVRPSNIGFQFQPRLLVKGWCRVRGLILHAQYFQRRLYSNPTC